MGGQLWMVFIFFYTQFENMHHRWGKRKRYNTIIYSTYTYPLINIGIPSIEHVTLLPIYVLM